MKQIPLEKLIRPTYMAWMFGAMAFFFLIFGIFIYLDKIKEVNYIIKESFHIKEQVEVNKILTQNDRYLKVQAMYANIIATYGTKYHPSKGKGNNQGLNHYQKADFMKEVYKLCTWLDIPYMWPMGKCSFESAFRPYVMTEYETGIWQQRHEYALMAHYYFQFLPESLKDKIHFRYKSREDLLDPINATRIEMIVIWGMYNYRFDHNLAWTYIASHWGESKIYPLYDKNIPIPEEYIFMKKNAERDARNPLMYYGVVYSYVSQFEKFSTKVWIDHSYIAAYKKECSRLERNYIEELEFIRDWYDLAKQYHKNNLEHEKKQKKIELKWEDKVTKLEDKYRELNGYIKAGKYRKVNDIFLEGKAHFKGLRDAIRKDQKKDAHNIFMILWAISLLIMLCCTVVLIIIWIKVIIQWLRKRKKKVSK